MGEGNFTYSGRVFTKEASDELGRIWVGPNYTVTSQGGFISEDQTRRYRPITYKTNSPCAETGFQSNFERGFIEPKTRKFTAESNLHLNIKEKK